MAAILNSGGSPATSAAPVAVTPTTTPSGLPVQVADTTTTATTGLFTQLIARMLGGAGAQPQQPAPLQPLPQDLATIEIDPEALDLPTSDDRDPDTDEGDDEEASPFLIATILPALPCMAPQTSATVADTGAASTDAIENAFIARRTEIDVSQAAVDELAGEPSDATSETTADPAAPSQPTAANTQNANPATHVHSLLTSHTARGHDAAAAATINAPVGTPAWQDELGTQLTWMAINNREAASLRLSPEHLGPLEVRISVREGEASVYFGASNAEARSALEQSLPRLRELFASQGLVLADAGVSRDAPRNAFKPSAQSADARGISDASADSPVSSVTLARVGLVDTYV
jgi:Flagellar hook-length control protein FliK